MEHTFAETRNKILKDFSKIQTIKHIELCSNLVKQKLELVNPSTVSKLKLDFLISNLMALMIFIYPKENLNKNSSDLIDYLIEKDLISKIFSKSISKIFFNTLNFNYSLDNNEIQSNGSKKKTKIGIKEKFKLNLDILFDKRKNNETLLNKNFGYSILDLNGDFIWADEKSQRLFEFKFENNDKNKNLFRFLIPFSYQQIINKFATTQNNNFCEIFKNKSVGDSVNISYIIYSKNNLNKFVKQIKKNKSFDKGKIEEEHRRGIFFKYLKGLSSRASLILLKFNFKELKFSYNENKNDINFGCSIKELFKNFNNISEEEKNKNIYRISILLETRLAKKIPNYDFNNMRNDKKIIEFDNIVKKKMNF